MSRRLVTVAAFDQPPKARLVQNVLEAEGIRVAINDESLVAMDWLLSNAIGGVKVQVWEEDAERAVAILEREFGEDGEKLDAPVEIDQEAFAAEAEAAAKEEGYEPERLETHDRGEQRQEGPSTTAVEADPSASGADSLLPSSRDECARRMVIVTILAGLVASIAFGAPLVGIVGSAPFFGYAIYLLLNAAFGEGELTPRGRLSLIAGVLLLSPFLTMVALVLLMLSLSGLS